jgi:hypothetical protein
LVAALTPTPSGAADGVIELSQAGAIQGGCVPGDAPLFPIALGQRGSYRLTSNLVVPDANTNGIEISSDDISIDFNGFTLSGPGNVPIVGHVCSAPGTGTGIVATGAAGGFVAQNGRVRGMGNSGIDVASGSRVRDSVADNNYVTGIVAGGASVVTHCIATTNGDSGLNFDLEASGGVAIGNAVVGNGWNTGFGGMDSGRSTGEPEQRQRQHRHRRELALPVASEAAR